MLSWLFSFAWDHCSLTALIFLAMAFWLFWKGLKIYLFINRYRR